MESEYGNFFLSSYQVAHDVNKCVTLDHSPRAALEEAALSGAPRTPRRKSAGLPGSLSVSASDSSLSLSGPAAQASPRSLVPTSSNTDIVRSESTTPPRRTAPAAEQETSCVPDAVWEHQHKRQQQQQKQHTQQDASCSEGSSPEGQLRLHWSPRGSIPRADGRDSLSGVAGSSRRRRLHFMEVTGGLRTAPQGSLWVPTGSTSSPSTSIRSGGTVLGMTTRRHQREQQQQQQQQQQQSQRPPRPESSAGGTEGKAPRGGADTHVDSAGNKGSQGVQQAPCHALDVPHNTPRCSRTSSEGMTSQTVEDVSGVQQEIEKVLNADDVWDAVIVHGGSHLSENTECFKVYVPPPYPGVQYRRSKDLSDTHPRYCRHGSTVSGILEDNGQWLRLHADIYLPTSVSGIKTLQRVTTRNTVKQPSAKKNGIDHQMQQSDQEQRRNTKCASHKGHQRRCCRGPCCSCCRVPDSEVVVDPALRMFEVSPQDDVGCAGLPTAMANAARSPAFPAKR